jgi:hypothetical protein
MSPFTRLALVLIMAVSAGRLGAAEGDELAALRAKAEKGNALAQYNLGLAYTQGRLGPIDLPEAFVWLSLASERGTTGKALDSVLGSITDEQLTEGRRRLEIYHTALEARLANASRNPTPRSGPRGFRLEAPAGSVPETREPEPVAPVTKPPEATPVVPATSPAEGAGLSELAQAQRELGEARANLQVVTAELAALRTNVATLEAAAATARATEARLTAELETVRKELEAAKAPAAPPPVEQAPPASPDTPRP